MASRKASAQPVADSEPSLLPPYDSICIGIAIVDGLTGGDHWGSPLKCAVYALCRIVVYTPPPCLGALLSLPSRILLLHTQITQIPIAWARSSGDYATGCGGRPSHHPPSDAANGAALLSPSLSRAPWVRQMQSPGEGQSDQRTSEHRPGRASTANGAPLL
jgi:hypothetical protein